jgi:hypothetical protein
MTRIVIAIVPGRFMRWQEMLRARLAARRPEAEVVFRLDPSSDGQPLLITQLLALERLLLTSGRPALCDRLPPPTDPVEPDRVGDVLVDLTGAGRESKTAKILRPLYDGQHGDQAAVAAILDGAPPTLAIEDAATSEIIAQGLPSFECAPSLTEGLDAVYSRTALLIERAIATPPSATERPPERRRRPRPPHRYLLETQTRRALRAIYHLCCHSPHWRIGWRRHDGPGLIDGGGTNGPAWTPLYDAHLGFAADPFPVQWRGLEGVFFESMDYRAGKGSISYQPFDAEGPSGEPIPCIEKPWHLSYPFLIEHDGELFMVPEASQSGSITLYHCLRFPDCWEAVSNLVENIEAADATIFLHGGRYWMTSVVRHGYGGYSDTLAIHYAPSLFGPWRPHDRFPVLIDSRHARPAGNVVRRNGETIRPVQNCAAGYGQGVTLMRIDRLDPEHFEQSPLETLSPASTWRNGRNFHTINRAGRLETIDGTVFAPKAERLRMLSNKFSV